VFDNFNNWPGFTSQRTTFQGAFGSLFHVWLAVFCSATMGLPRPLGKTRVKARPSLVKSQRGSWQLLQFLLTLALWCLLFGEAEHTSLCSSHSVFHLCQVEKLLIFGDWNWEKWHSDPSNRCDQLNLHFSCWNRNSSLSLAGGVLFFLCFGWLRKPRSLAQAQVTDFEDPKM
jgi:hypothetical protein